MILRPISQLMVLKQNVTKYLAHNTKHTLVCESNSLPHDRESGTQITVEILAMTSTYPHYVYSGIFLLFVHPKVFSECGYLSFEHVSPSSSQISGAFI